MNTEARPDIAARVLLHDVSPNTPFIFVFGSNLSGRHGKGAALTAKQDYGAIYGQGEGLQGSSYGIPTKDRNLCILPLKSIEFYVNRFIQHARANPENRYYVTRIGCGLAGFKDHDIGPLFKLAPQNCALPSEWFPYLHEHSS